MEITQEMIDDCLKDTSINGKLVKLFYMIQQSMDNYYPIERMNSIAGTLQYCDIDTSKMSQFEMLNAYSELI